MASLTVKTDWITGREVSAESFLFIEKLMKLRENKRPWEALSEIVAFYKKHYPKEYEETVLISRDLRGTRGDEWGRGNKLLHKESREANLRMVMNLPFRLISIIRKIYNETELPFDRQFLKKFGIMYPEFLVPKKGNKAWSHQK